MQIYRCLPLLLACSFACSVAQEATEPIEAQVEQEAIVQEVEQEVDEPEVVTIAEPEEAQPKPAPAQHAEQTPDIVEVEVGGDETKEPLTVERTHCSSARCSMRFTFSLPMIRDEDLDQKPDLVRFDPPQPGRFHWQNNREIVFEPGSRGLSNGHTITVAIDRAVPLAGEALALSSYQEEFTVPYFTMAGKYAGWPVIQGQPRLVAFLDSYSSKVGPGPLILLFDQPVNHHNAGRFITATNAKEEPLELACWRPRAAESVSGVALDPKYALAIRMKELPGSGETVNIHFPTWEKNERESEERSFTVSDSLALAVEALPSFTDSRAPQHVNFPFRFDNPIATKTLKKHLTISPPPESLQTYIWEESAEVSVTLKPGTHYRLRLSGNFRDLLGNRLGRDFKMRFRTEDLPALVEAPQLPVQAERNNAVLPIRLRNVKQIRGRLYRFGSVANYVRWSMASGDRVCPADGSKPFTLRTVRINNDLNEMVERSVSLPKRLGSFLGCVEIDAAGRGSVSEDAILNTASLVQVSGLGLTAKVSAGEIFVWVTDLNSGTAKASSRVVLYDGAGEVITSAKTDEYGIARLKGSLPTNRDGLTKASFLYAEAKNDKALMQLDQGRLSQPWQFNLTGSVEGAEKLTASLFMDRGVYRPKETAHVKMIVRDPSNGSLRVPSAHMLKLRVRDPRGKYILDRVVTLDRFGTADVDVQLKENANVGLYTVSLSQGDRYLHRNFRVEEYRVPTFEVAVKSPSDWKRRARVVADLSARYLHGGALAGREVRYEVVRAPARFEPKNGAGFVFAQPARGAAGAVKTGETKLDGQGRHRVAFTIDHPANVGPMRYTVLANVTDVDRQAYSGRFSQVVHPAALYVGVRPPSRAILASGSRLDVPVIVVNTKGERLTGVETTLHLSRVDHHTVARIGTSVQRLNRPVAETASVCRKTSSASPITCSFQIEHAGRYRVVARAKDRAGQLVESGFEVVAHGNNTIAWPRFAHERIDLVTDKARYHPGDVAQVMVESPFSESTGLLTIERDGVIESRVFTINEDAPALPIPITKAHVPNIFVSVVLLRGRVHDLSDATGFETGAPAFRMGYVNLSVDPDVNRLRVAVKSARSSHPGATLPIELSVRDHQGHPRAGQATVMVVDEAVLGLTGYRTPDPIRDLFLERPLAVRTAESRLDLPGAMRVRRERIFPSGDGGEGFALGDFPADIRSLFMSTAYFNPNVTVGADGRARVSVDLPDNVTTYRIMAVVVDEGAAAGTADQRLLVKKPLIVQPVLPRFLHRGDALVVEARVFNGTGKSGSAHVTAGFEGLELATGSLTARREVAKSGDTTFSFPVRVTGYHEAKVRFGAVLGAHTDAVDVTLPIYNYGTKKTLLLSKRVKGVEQLTLAIPEEREPHTPAQVELLVSTTQLTELKPAVDYLMGYPHGCIEQTTSRAYPLVVLKDLLPSIGVTVDEKKLEEFSKAGVKRILSFQTSAGGLSYWPGGRKPHAFATAFGLTALIEAQQRGYDVPQERLAKMAAYLETALRRGKIQESIPHGGMPDADSRAFFVMTLGRLGRPQHSYVSTLWAKRDQLSAFGMSFLAIAVKEGAGDSSLLRPMLAEVRRVATEEVDQAYFEGRPKGGYSFGSPLRTHASALLAYATSNGDAGMSGKFLQGLLKRRRGGLWGNTQENVFGIMGVATMVGVVGKQRSPLRDALKEGPKLELAFNGRPVPRTDLETLSPHTRRLVLHDPAISFNKGAPSPQTFRIASNGNPLNVTMRATYEAMLSEEEKKAKSHGFLLSRQYETLQGEPIKGRVPLGEVLRVRLRIKADRKHNYVAIDDRLPAGLEPLNSSLKTTEKVSLGPVSETMKRSISQLSHQEIRDERVSFYVDNMPAGDYEYVYLARATLAGDFLRPAARVEAMYQPRQFATSAIDEVTIR